MTNTIKCPQCGAAHVNHVSQNKYSCPFCGHVFYIEGHTEFIKQETDEFKQAQIIERDELERSLAQKKKNRIIFALATSVSLIIILIISVIAYNVFRDKQIKFSSLHEMCAFLEAGPFVYESDTIFFSDFATKVKINGQEYFSEPYNYFVFIENGMSFETYTNYNETKAILYDSRSEKKYVRDANLPIKDYFEFSSESSVREYLANAIFSNDDVTIRFEDNGNTLVINDAIISSNLNIFCMKGKRIEHKESAELIKSRASITVNGSGIRYELNLIMDQQGNNAYLIDIHNFNTDRINYKYRRIH